MLQEIRAYIMDAMSSNSMKSSNPHSGVHETQVSKCLDTMCLDPSCNQGGVMVCYRKKTHPHSTSEGQGYEETSIADTLNAFDNGEDRTPVIVLEGNGARPSHMGNGYRESDVMYTLNTIEQHSVCYAVDCRNNCLVREMSSTLQAKPQGGWSVNVTNPLLIVNGDEKH